MSNQNIIFAYAKRTNVGAKSADGITWHDSSIALSSSYLGMTKEESKFTYLIVDNHYSKSVNSFTIVDNTNWKTSVMPLPQSPCTIAIAKGLSNLFYSFSNGTFIKGPNTL